MVRLPFCGGLVVEGGVDSPYVVSADPGEDVAACLFSGRESGLCDELSFQGWEERLDDAVVPALSGQSWPGAGKGRGRYGRWGSGRVWRQISTNWNSIRYRWLPRHWDDAG